MHPWAAGDITFEVWSLARFVTMWVSQDHGVRRFLLQLSGFAISNLKSTTHTLRAVCEAREFPTR